jgi:regulator of sirC expression with transglutaminase-like and TPR domain
MASGDGGPGAFAALTQGADASIDLARAAIAIGRVVTPDVDADATLAALESFASRVRSGTGADPTPSDIVGRTRTVLFGEEGFSGDGDDYYHPLNSCLHAVVERKRGMPILLSVLFIEVAGRAGLEVQGVGAPGHFLVKYRDGQNERYLDPFHAGREVPADGLRAAVDQALGGPGSPDAYLEAVTKRQILSRILTNLKGSLLRRSEMPQALDAVDYLLAMTPWDLGEVRDKGLLLYQLDRPAEALTWLRRYREHAQDDPGLPRVEALITRLEHEAEDASP